MLSAEEKAAIEAVQTAERAALGIAQTEAQRPSSATWCYALAAFSFAGAVYALLAGVDARIAAAVGLSATGFWWVAGDVVTYLHRISARLK